MKKAFASICCIAFFIFVLFTVACCALPLTEWTHPSAARMFSQPNDFNLRYNEACCVRDGADPFDVWKNYVVRKPYLPMGSMAHDGFSMPVNGYTPWGYALALPLSLLPPSTAWCVYAIFMLACLVPLLCGGFGIGRRLRCDRWTSLIFATLPLLVVAYPIWSNFCIGNYAVPILAALFMMCWCLDRGYDTLAGVFWAMAMIKPQNSLLLAVPLLMRGKIKTCCVALSLCLALALLPALLCHKSVIAMVLQIPSVGSGAFFGCATLPSYIRNFMDSTSALALAAGVGLILCVWLTLCMRKSKCWIFYAMPAVICSISWTYTTSYSFALAWFLCVAILARLAIDRSAGTIALLCCAIVLLPRFWTCFCGASNAFAFCTIPPSVCNAIDTTVSLAILVLTIVFCLRLRHAGFQDCHA